MRLHGTAQAIGHVGFVVHITQGAAVRIQRLCTVKSRIEQIERAEYMHFLRDV